MVWTPGEAVLWGQNVCWFRFMSSLSPGKPESTQECRWATWGWDDEERARRWFWKLRTSVLRRSHTVDPPPSPPAAQLQEQPWNLRIVGLQLPGPGEPQRAWNIITPTEPSPALSTPEKPMDICPIIGWINKWLPDEITPGRICGKTEIGRWLCNPTLVP